MNDTHPHTDTHDAHDDHGLAHPMPMKILAGVFAALLFLTWLTVSVTWVDLGPLNIWIALFIAVIKAGLVAMYFMHLRYDAPFNGIVLLSALLFVAIFIAATLSDSANYQQTLEPPTAAQQAGQ